MERMDITEAIRGLSLAPPGSDIPPEICPYSDRADPHPPIEHCEGGHLIGDGGYHGMCPCYVAYRQRRNVETYLDQFGHDMRTQIVNARHDTGAMALVIREWWSADEPSPRTQALLLSGEPGTGKTLAAHATAIRLIRTTGRRAHYVAARDIGRWVSDLASPDAGVSLGARDHIDTIYDRMDPDRWIIVIDDLGRERNSGTMPQYVADIISAIYERRTRAIISTNLSSRQVGDRYGSEIRSRLLDNNWITPIRCTGDDLRIRRNDTGGSNDTE